MAQIDETGFHEVTARSLEIQGERYQVWTGGEGPPLLLLHAGLGDAQFSWQTVWHALSDHFSVIAPDLPGFGKSPAFKHPSLELLTNFLRELL
jgi:pimeloyl-ACP methyl ester carboxylesterase